MNENYKDCLQFEVQAVAEGGRMCLHKQMTFALVYIIEGRGSHQLEQASLSFEPGDLFMVTPGEEVHYLRAATPTRFLKIRFTCLFVSRGKSPESAMPELVHILYYANQNPCYITHLRENGILGRQLAEYVLKEVELPKAANRDYTEQLVYLILLLLQKEIKSLLPGDIALGAEQRAVNMLHYIHLNIFDPKKLTIREMSKKFFISPAYLGKYFKSNTNKNLHEYILFYKLRLIESRLKDSDMRISEIADEFGFSDKSYLNKLFVKYKGISPLQYRNNAKALQVVARA
ncbi:AraC family transcriptional regulator [Flavobacterium beibuense]|uniref:AraC family transcriptional regulator n=2 Tax=Flavobacterium beibuense TaxID=657326 RepID=A0A444WEI3_9FLAO|nr:AraC family transcriptional regulator [Flavobacterium beibuense]